MGSSLSWIAIRGKTHAALQDQMEAAGIEPFRAPAKGVTWMDLPEGWAFAIASGYAHAIMRDSMVAMLSAGCDVITCQVDEHVMSSETAYWRDGHRIWNVTHHGERDVHDLEVHGDPPAAFESIRAECMARQKAEGGARARVDYVFEIPVAIAHTITGFRHDETSDSITAGRVSLHEEISSEATNSTDRRDTLSAPRNPAHLVLLPLALGSAGLFSYALVQFGMRISMLWRPDIIAFSSYHPVTRIVIAVPSLLASLPIGLLVSNSIAWSIPLARNFFDTKARQSGDPLLERTLLGLVRLARWWTPLFAAIGFAATVVGP